MVGDGRVDRVRGELLFFSRTIVTTITNSSFHLM